MFYGVAAAALALRPRILHGEHGLNVEDLGQRNLKRSLGQRALASLADLIIPVNAVIAGHLRENWKLRESRYRVVPNGVDLARFRPAASLPEALVVGTVARMEPIKDLACLLQAASRLDRGPRIPFRLVLVGDGPLRKDLESLARELGIGDRVEFTGEVEDVHLKYPSFSLLVNCSVYEGMSNTILEGMACGLPILASRVPGNQLWLKDGENALFFDPGDAEGLAAAIRAVWGDRERASALGRNNRARVEREFANGKFIESYLDVYRTILGKRFPEARPGLPTA
jgi:glycosyltransferase involved in cell wall biosynthesis